MLPVATPTHIIQPMPGSNTGITPGGGGTGSPPVGQTFGNKPNYLQQLQAMFSGQQGQQGQQDPWEMMMQHMSGMPGMISGQMNHPFMMGQPQPGQPNYGFNMGGAQGPNQNSNQYMSMLQNIFSGNLPFMNQGSGQ